MATESMIEAVFSLDCTTSMKPCLEEVKRHLEKIVTKLQRDISGIRIAVVAHGDYPGSPEFSKWHKFVIKTEDFSTDLRALLRFISGLQPTHGIDSAEAYELALQEINGLSWTPGSRRVAVVIGDQVPHEPGSERDVQNIDWRAEVDKLVAKGVKIHGVQCLDKSRSKRFYRHLADKSGGRHLRLREFSIVQDLVMAICYREQSVRSMEGYEEEVIRRDGAINANMAEIFAALRQSDDH